MARYITYDAVHHRGYRIPWYLPRRYDFRRDSYEVGGLIDVLRWFGENVYFSFARYQIHELGMPKPKDWEGRYVGFGEFMREWWNWCGGCNHG